MSFFNVEIVWKPTVNASPVISVKFEGVRANSKSDAAGRALANLAADKACWQIVRVVEL